MRRTAAARPPATPRSMAIGPSLLEMSEALDAVIRLAFWSCVDEREGISSQARPPFDEDSRQEVGKHCRNDAEEHDAQTDETVPPQPFVGSVVQHLDLEVPVASADIVKLLNLLVFATSIANVLPAHRTFLILATTLATPA